MKKQMLNVKGGCLCGAVQFEINGEASAFFMCHCNRCRHATGSAHASNIFSKPDALKWIAGENLIKRFKLPSAERFSKQFCSNCGSPVPHESIDGKHLVIPAGSLNTDIGLSPQANIFWESKACWVEDGRNAIRFSEYPVM